ncbi:hypothetical protein JOB18_036874 [Solea senegalensis]|uniref:Uncharacterized protein n=1 Tax=Solea senegalensis TaxID=28829 RepID=A0AAV6PJL1_SOLSE|nr:hypothetical protein JOB18_036874 [Solea senegalensis]
MSGQLAAQRRATGGGRREEESETSPGNQEPSDRCKGFRERRHERQSRQKTLS